MSQTQQSTASDAAGVDPETIATIRVALLIGLSCYGEIERLANQVGILELCRKNVPDELRPIHPTGCADTVSDFADALRLLEQI